LREKNIGIAGKKSPGREDKGMSKYKLSLVFNTYEYKDNYEHIVPHEETVAFYKTKAELKNSYDRDVQRWLDNASEYRGIDAVIRATRGGRRVSLF
jgi:Zn/Cd-binding protein ZinT